MHSPDAEISADNLSGSSRVKSQHPSDQNTIYDLPFLVSVFTTLPASPFLAVNAQTGQFIFKQGTVSEGAHFQICNQIGFGDRVTWRQRSTR